MASTRLVIVRHGQTEWNRLARFRGRADVPLNEAGMRQAQAAAAAISGRCRVQAVYYSDLARTRATAQALADACRAPMTPEAGLLDIDYGEWTGLSPDEVRQRDPDLLALWQSQPQRVQIPGGEGLDAARKRALACMEHVAAQYLGQTVALVSHLVICRLLILAALGLDSSRFWRIRQDNAAFNILEWQDGVYTVVTINETCHLTA